MRIAWLLPTLAAACAHTAAPPPIANTVDARGTAGPRADCVVAGVIRDATGEPLVGATIVASWPGAGDDPPAQITDEAGRFSFAGASIPRPAMLTIYYNDSTFQNVLPRCLGDLRLTVDLTHTGAEVAPIVITGP